MMNMGETTRRARGSSGFGSSSSSAALDAGSSIEIGHAGPEEQQHQMAGTDFTKQLPSSASQAGRLRRERISRRQKNKKTILFTHVRAKLRRLRFELKKNPRLAFQFGVAGFFLTLVLLMVATVFIYIKLNKLSEEVVVIDDVDNKLPHSVSQMGAAAKNNLVSEAAVVQFPRTREFPPEDDRVPLKGDDGLTLDDRRDVPTKSDVASKESDTNVKNAKGTAAPIDTEREPERNVAEKNRHMEDTRRRGTVDTIRNKFNPKYLTFVDPIESPKEVIPTSIKQQRPTAIVFPEVDVKNSWIISPNSTIQSDGEPDFGELHILIMEETGAARVIYHDHHLDMTDYHDPDKKIHEDDVDQYYAFDDDYERNEVAGYDSDDSEEHSMTCRRFSEHMLNLRNCNTFHETPYLESKVKYLGEGAYRQVLSVRHVGEDEVEEVVIKEYLYENDFGVDGFEFVRMDAIVAERLSPSPRTYDIYGFCSMSIMSEIFHHGDIEPFTLNGKGYMKQEDLDKLQKDDVAPQNNLTSEQKLVLALQMAEALAELHGYKNSLIIHDDIQLSQFLLNEDKSIVKINDFNRAEFPLWSDTEHQYCTYKNGRGHGNWRAPEEYMDGPLDEKIDIWSFGCNMYSLLTGLNPFYHYKKDKDMQKETKNGKTAFIDPRYRSRSVEEKKLAEIIDECWKYKPDDRPSIFEVVSFLRNSVNEALGENVDIPKILRSINTTKL